MIDLTLIPRTHDIGGFEVRRALPSRHKRMVGPFIFWDQMGPGEFITGQGVDVRPHPHIGLSTLTYLFDGSLMHRDSLGVAQRIEPGAVNLMTAGKGIVHSERTESDVRQHPHKLFGIQSWLALPKRHEEADPDFVHIAQDKLPVITQDLFSARLIAGNYEGVVSPFSFPHDTLYMDIHLKAGGTFHVPDNAEERALYPLSGRLQVGDTVYDAGQLLVLTPSEAITIRAAENTPCHVMLLGGAVMDGPRHIWWNFVSSDKALLEAAKADWLAQRFPKVPGESEFIPLPAE